MKKYNCVFGICMFYLFIYLLIFYLRDENNTILFKEGEKKEERMTKWWTHRRQKKEFRLVNGLHYFQLIYKKTIHQCYFKTKNYYG